MDLQLCYNASEDTFPLPRHIYCAHRTSTFLSCAFREQEDD